MSKILIADLFKKETMSDLEKEGFKIMYDPSLSGDKFKAALQKHFPQIVIIRSTKMNSDIIKSACKSVKLIIRAGSGVDNIDIKEASNRNIQVANCPGMNAIAVAELVMGLILSIDRRIPDGVQLMKEGKWRKGEFVKQPGLFGKTLGCLGFGFVAQQVAIRAKAFGMNIITYSINKSEVDLTKTVVKFVDSIETLFKNSDFITIHVPKTKLTFKMVNSKLLSLMKPGAVLVNTSRGDIIESKDIMKKLQEDKTFWYAADVHDKEPGAKKADYKPDLAKQPRMYGTHHIGAGTLQAESAVGEQAARVVRVFSKKGRIDAKNWVNMKLMPKL